MFVALGILLKYAEHFCLLLPLLHFNVHAKAEAMRNRFENFMKTVENSTGATYNRAPRKSILRVVLLLSTTIAHAIVKLLT